MAVEKTILASVLSYSKSQRIGIILFFLLVLLLQCIYFYYDFATLTKSAAKQSAWLAHQNEIDDLKRHQNNAKPIIYPFNPNFISDFKGYKLGMSTAEIDRLLTFRKQNKFVNSVSEFQNVTHVSDSLLKSISPYFKFPDWVANKKAIRVNVSKEEFSKHEKISILDINQASKEDLMKLNGIGDKISDRILEQKEKLGCFVSMEQMKDIWGLSPEVIEQLNSFFIVKSMANIKRIKINYVSVKELSRFPFFNYALAKEVVIYRTMHGDIQIEDLSKIKGFPVDKIKIIALYLEF